MPLVFFCPKRASVAAPIPLPSDYWHVSNASYASSAYAPQESSIAGGSTALAVTVLTAVPLFVGRLGRTITALGARYSSLPGAGAIVKLAIYDCLPPASNDVYPQNYVAGVELTLTASVGVQTANLASPVLLPNGLYWIAVAPRSGSQGQIRALNESGLNQVAGRNPLQWTGAVINSSLVGTLTNALPMPTTFPSGAAMNASKPMFEVI